jgi:hypothetical protein
MGPRCQALPLAGVTVFVALVAVALASCTSPAGSPRPTPSAAGPTSPMAHASRPPPPTTPGGRATSDTKRFTLMAGSQHNVCGIGLRVAFIPPSGGTGQGYQAFLVAGPTSGFPDTTPTSTGDTPPVGTVAPARVGTVATVLGKRFRVISVDVLHRRVVLEALC